MVSFAAVTGAGIPVELPSTSGCVCYVGVGRLSSFSTGPVRIEVRGLQVDRLFRVRVYVQMYFSVVRFCVPFLNVSVMAA